MCALDPHTEPERFYEFAVRQCEQGLPVLGDVSRRSVMWRCCVCG